MGGHGNASRTKYWVIFGVLAFLTVLEVLVAFITGMRNFVIAALIGLAVAKAGCVLLWYMHLIDESKVLKQTVILPFIFPVFYAVVLVAEALYRGGIGIFTT